MTSTHQGNRVTPDGILAVDKPPEITSAKALDRVKKILHVKKAGHTGTLDPFATGVLVCCLGKATRLAKFFLHGDKTYEAVMRLGVETDTQDLTGQVVNEQEVLEISRERLEEVLAGFVGEIDQVPPIYSALKHEGVPLYKLARKGAPVQKDARKVTIHSLEITDVNLPMVRFTARCSGGTYIRTLCYDIGCALGCGAHLHALRRTENSGFDIAEALTLDQLENIMEADRLNEHVISMAGALRHMPQFQVVDSVAKKISHGTALTWLDLGQKPGRQDGLPDNTQYVKAVDDRENLLAVLIPKTDGVGLTYDCVFPQSPSPGKKPVARFSGAAQSHEKF